MRTATDHTIDALSIQSALAAKHATERLAIAAACEERIEQLEREAGREYASGAGQNYFLVRALCHEHRLDYERTVQLGREFASRF